MSRNDLTPAALEGYAHALGEPGNANTYLRTSPSWFAHELGQYLQRTGRTLPKDVRMGRGYQIHGNGMLFAFDARYAITRVK